MVTIHCPLEWLGSIFCAVETYSLSSPPHSCRPNKMRSASPREHGRRVCKNRSIYKMICWPLRPNQFMLRLCLCIKVCFPGCRVYHWRHRSSKALGGMDSEPLTIQVFHKEAEAWMDCEGLPAVASHCDCSEVWEYDTSNFTMPEWHSAITERKRLTIARAKAAKG